MVNVAALERRRIKERNSTISLPVQTHKYLKDGSHLCHGCLFDHYLVSHVRHEICVRV